MANDTQPKDSASLVKQSIDWIKNHQAELTTAYIESFAALPSKYFQNRTQAQHLDYAEKNINGLIGRLEGKPYDGTRVRKLFEQSLEKGVSFEDLQLGMNCMSEVFAKKLAQDQSVSVEMRNFLNGKIEYIRNLFVASLASAHINIQSRKK